MGLTRVLKTASTTLTRTFYIDEAPTDTTAPPQVTVRRLDGTIVTGPTAATGPVGGPGTGTYTYILPGGPTAGTSATYRLDLLDVSWVGQIGGAVVTLTDRVEVVGGFYFGLKEGRDSDSSLSSTTNYPTAKLARARIDVENECERITGQAWVPRFARVTLNGTGTNELLLPHAFIRNPIRAVSVSDTGYGGTFTALGTTDLALSNADYASVLYRSQYGYWPVGSQNIIVEYEHGHDFPPPDLADVSMIRFRSILNRARTGVPDRAERIITVEGGATFLLSMPTEEKTGIPEVDATYARYAHGKIPGIA